jgi:hypothetical protein
MRLRRICSDAIDFSNQCSRYAKFFLQRGYDSNRIQATISEVSKMSREDLLNPSHLKDNEDRVVFVCNWHPRLSALPKILKEHHYILRNNRQVSSIFKYFPLVAFRKAKSIRDVIVRTDISPPPKPEYGTKPCQSCKSACHLICEDNKIVNSKNGKSLDVRASGNCKTSDIVYVARCKVCDILYVGETKEELRSRFSKHRYDAKKRPENCELAAHVHAMKHDFDRDIEVTVLQQGFKSDAERKFSEDKYICQLGTLTPNGLNKDLENYAREMYELHQDL